MEGELRVLIQWVVVVLYIGAMFLYAGQEASSAGYTNQLLAKWFPWLSHSEIREYVVLVRKMGHVLAYGCLTLIVYSAARKTKRLQRLALPFAVIFSLLVAIMDESYQRRLVYRTGSWSDVLIDGMGIAIVVLILMLRSRMKRRRNEEVSEDVENECS